MFNYETEKRVIKLICETYDSTNKLCENPPIYQSFKIGIKFRTILEKFQITSTFGYVKNEFGVCRDSSLFDEEKWKLGQTLIDGRPGITKDFNYNEIQFVMLLQIVLILQKLEKEGLIIILSERESNFNYNGKSDAVVFKPISDDSLIKFIKSIYNSRIIPTIDLLGYKHNGYKTDSEVRFEKEQCAAWSSIAIALIFGFLSICIAYFKDTHIDEIQFRELTNKIDTYHSVSDTTTFMNPIEITHEKIKHEKQ